MRYLARSHNRNLSVETVDLGAPSQGILWRVAVMSVTLGVVGPIGFIVTPVGVALAGKVTVVRDSKTTLQRKTEDEDRVAINAFKASLKKYQVVLSHKKGTAVRRSIQARIGEIYFEMAAVQFRQIHSESGRKYKKHAEADYRRTLHMLVKIEGDLVRSDHHPERFPRYLFILAKANKELGKSDEAIGQFKELLDKYPHGKDSVDAVMSLHELLTSRKDYKTAIHYLKKVRVSQKDRYYPVIMDYFAYDYYYSNNIGKAIRYLEAEWQYYGDLGEEYKDSHERAQVLKNLALFYSSAMEAKMASFTIQGFYKKIRGLSPGKLMGPTLKLFGGFLRSKGRYREFEELKTILVHSGSRKSDAVEFLLEAMDKEVERREFSYLRDSSKSLLKILESNDRKGVSDELMKTVLSSVQGFASTLQGQYSKAKGADRSLLRDSLIGLYSDLLVMVEDDKVIGAQVHFNLAELYFASKDYPRAIPHYKWVFSDNRSSVSDEKMLLKAHYRGIVSRFEVLLSQGLMPKSVKAKSYDLAKEQEIVPEFVEWTKWLRDYARAGGKESLDFYYFELIQTLYAKGHVEESNAWVDRFLERFSKSKYFVSAASLKLDTFVLASRWDEAIESAGKIIKLTPSTQRKFREKVGDIRADCRFKKIEGLYQKKQYSDVVEQSQEFVKENPKSSRLADAQALAGNAALGMNNRKAAIEFFRPLIALGLRGKPVPKGALEVGLLTQSAIEEEEFRISGALREYLKYLKTHKGKSDFKSASIRAVREKTLLLAWMTGSRRRLNEVLDSSLVCDTDLRSLCGKYAAIAHYGRTSTNKSHYARYASGSLTRFFDSVTTLKSKKWLKLNDRVSHLRTMASGWDAQDEMVKYRVLSDMTLAIPDHLQRAVRSVRRDAPLRFDKAKINERVRLIKKVERVIEKLIKLPWMGIQVASMNAWADLYADLARDFSRLRPGKMSASEKKEYRATVQELRQPFELKALDLRKKAYKLGFDSVVATNIFGPVAQAIVKQDSSYPKETYKSKLPSMDLDLILMAALETQKVNPAWFAALKDATRHKNWAAVSYLVQESTVKSFLSPDQQALARAISLSLASCQSEALAEVRSPRVSFSSTTGGLIQLGQGIGYYGVRSKEATKTALEGFFSDTNSKERKPVLNPSHSMILVDAMDWAKVSASGKVRDEAAGWSGDPEE